jgi:hypothetical protein
MIFIQKLRVQIVTSIATVQDHYLTFGSFLTPIFSRKCLFKISVGENVIWQNLRIGSFQKRFKKFKILFALFRDQPAWVRIRQPTTWLSPLANSCAVFAMQVSMRVSRNAAEQLDSMLMMSFRMFCDRAASGMSLRQSSASMEEDVLVAAGDSSMVSLMLR